MPDTSPPASPPQALLALVGYLSNHFHPEDAPALPEQLRGLLLSLGASQPCAEQAWACVVAVLEHYRHTPEGAAPPLDEYRASVLAELRPESLPPEEAGRLRWFAAAPLSEVRLLVSRAMAVAALREALAQLPAGTVPTLAHLRALVGRPLWPSTFTLTLVEAELARALHELHPSAAALNVWPWLATATPEAARELLQHAALLAPEPRHAQP